MQANTGKIMSDIDNRQYIRHPSDIPLKYALIDAPTHRVKSTHNISIGGLSFSAIENLAIDSWLTITALIIVSATLLSHSLERPYLFGRPPFLCRPPWDVHIFKQELEHCPWLGVKKSFSSSRTVLAFYKEIMDRGKRS